MSSNASPASADFAVEIHVASDDEQTLLHDAKPDAEPHSESDDRWMSQQRQLIQFEIPEIPDRPVPIIYQHFVELLRSILNHI